VNVSQSLALHVSVLDYRYTITVFQRRLRQNRRHISFFSPPAKIMGGMGEISEYHNLVPDLWYTLAAIISWHYWLEHTKQQ